MSYPDELLDGTEHDGDLVDCALCSEPTAPAPVARVAVEASVRACPACAWPLFPGFTQRKIGGLWHETVTCRCGRTIVGERIRELTDREYWANGAQQRRDAELEARWWSEP
jgi:hypothetical protein